jgi:hypothetical protein
MRKTEVRLRFSREVGMGREGYDLLGGFVVNAIFIEEPFDA